MDFWCIAIIIIKLPQLKCLWYQIRLHQHNGIRCVLLHTLVSQNYMNTICDKLGKRQEVTEQYGHLVCMSIQQLFSICGSPGQYRQHHLRVCLKCQCSGLTPHLLNHKLQEWDAEISVWTGPPRHSKCTLNVENQ